MAASGRVQIIPKEICVRIDRWDALGAGGNVCQQIPGRRCNDSIEESKDVELKEIEMLAWVKVAQDSKTCDQDLIIENACLGRGCRSGRRAIKPGNQSKRREVGNDEVSRPGLDEALDIIGLIDGRADHVIR